MEWSFRRGTWVSPIPTGELAAWVVFLLSLTSHCYKNSAPKFYLVKLCWVWMIKVFSPTWKQKDPNICITEGPWSLLCLPRSQHLHHWRPMRSSLSTQMGLCAGLQSWALRPWRRAVLDHSIQSVTCLQVSILSLKKIKVCIEYVYECASVCVFVYWCVGICMHIYVYGSVYIYMDVDMDVLWGYMQPLFPGLCSAW